MINLLKEPQWVFGVDGLQVPSWFHGVDTYLQFIFFLATLIIGIKALRIYRFARHQDSKYLGIGFLLISLSYFTWSFLNTAVLPRFGQFLCKDPETCTLYLIIDLSIYAHMVLFSSGLLILASRTFNRENKNIFVLFSIIIISFLIFSQNALGFFYIMSFVLFLYLTFFYARRFLSERRKRIRIWMPLAYAMLAASSIFMIFGLDSGKEYVIANLLILAAYAILIFHLLKRRDHEKTQG